jgi:hypothetical protein
MRLFRPAVAALVVLLVVVAVTGRGDDQVGDTFPLTGEGTDRPAADTSPVDGEVRESVRIYLDAWSKATLGGRPVTIDGVEITWVPVEHAHLTQLLGDAPDLVGRTIARLVTADVDLFCAVDGCQVREIPVGIDQLADLGHVEVFGAMYRQLGLTHGLWYAEVPVTRTSASGLVDGAFVVVAADGFSELVLVHQPFADPEVDDDLEASDDRTPREPANGFGKGLFLVAAGAGQLFTPEPQWVGGDGTGFDRLNLLPVDAPSAPTGEPVFGPSVTDQGVLRLTNGLLTYATSPTTGCGGLMVCTVGAVTARVENYQRSDHVIGQDGFDGDGLLLLISYDLVFDLDHQAHTAVVWDGAVPPFENQNDMITAVFAGYPPLHTGPAALRISLALVVVDAGEPLVANLAYRVAQHGFGDDTHRYQIGDLPDLFAGRYRLR